MLEDIYRDDLIGDPNDLEEIIEGDLDDPQNEGNDNEDEIAGEGNQPDPTGTPVEPKKRKVLRPQPKLNAERLKGPRGIATLENVFKDFKFHGKGYEKHDLDRVMNQMKHWAHRLYPRFQFDDCLEKIEKLGHKKPLQTYVKKIRMGLETSEEPMNLIDDDDIIDTGMFADNDLQPPVDAFDELLSQQLSEMRARQTSQPPVASQRVLQQPVILTTEQKERMLRNRLMAEERRLARLKAQQDKSKNSELDNTNHKQAIKGENSSVSTMECFDISNGGEKTNCVNVEDDEIIDLNSNLSLSQTSKRDNNISHIDNDTHNMSTLKDIPDIEKVQSKSSANANDEQLTIHATSMEIDVFTDEVTFPSPDNGTENMFTKPSITFRSENAPETKNVTIMEHDVNTNKTNNHTDRKVCSKYGRHVCQTI
uniref:TIMELESS-interacting protein n=1 Tax=Timema poppense TaxID=170557 RepID=A0A7R9DBW6_TIMPO|nr:unnamed protein product [Timema poppensis]